MIVDIPLKLIVKCPVCMILVHHSHMQLFLKPIRVGCLLPPDTITTIFSNIEAILSVNQELFSCMRQRSLGEAFSYLGPFLKLYSTYAESYQDANEKLQVCPYAEQGRVIVVLYLSACQSVQRYKKNSLWKSKLAYTDVVYMCVCILWNTLDCLML